MEINEIALNYEIVKPKKLRIKIDIQIIQNIVCNYFQINYRELLQRNRERHIVEKKQIFQYLCNIYTTETLSGIGEYKGFNYHHATVLNSVKTVCNLIDTDEKFRLIIFILELEVRKAQVIFLDKDDFRTIKYNLSRDITNCKNYSELQSILIKYMVNNN